MLWWEGHFVKMAAVVAAFTGLDEHGQPQEAFFIWANESHRHSACAARGAAPSVFTHATVVGSIEADTLALTVRQVDGFWGFVGGGTLLPFLWC